MRSIDCLLDDVSDIGLTQEVVISDTDVCRSASVCDV